VTSIQPFEMEWGVIKSKDPFLVTQAANDELKTGLDKDFNVWCKVKNVTKALDLQLTKI
jgi:hypothetical protein